MQAIDARRPLYRDDPRRAEAVRGTASRSPAVEAQGLVKTYGEVRAVDGLDLSIEANTIYALLGPNGAGKTTALSILTTVLEPTAGQAQVCGFDVAEQAHEVRRRIGVTFQETVLDESLTGRQALDFHGKLYRQSRARRKAKAEELLSLVELEDAADRKIRTYSGGMKRRLELARGLMTEPEVLFLDEPTLGLDPQSRAALGDYILDLKATRGLTLILTTHYMDEAQLLSDRVGIIDRGKLVEEGTPKDLIEQMGADVIRVEGRGESERFLGALASLPFTEEVSAPGSAIQIGVDSGSHRLAEVVLLAQKHDFQIEDISVSEPSLGDVFLRYTGRQLRD